MIIKTLIKKQMKLTGSILLGFCIVAGLGMLLLSHAAALNRVADFLETHTLYLNLLRYGAIAIFIYYYPRLLRRAYDNKPDINQAALAKYSRRRYPIIFFIILEILIAQHGLAWLINSIIN